MKCMLVLALALFATVFAEEQYSAENDDLDIEAVISDIKQLQNFAGCFNGNSECNELLIGFKKDLPEAVQQACAKCTPAQKHILKRFLEALKEKLPADLQTFQATYDPENKYFAALIAAISKA